MKIDATSLEEHLRNPLDHVLGLSAHQAHPQTIMPALVAALTICGMLGWVSLLVPPFIENDTGLGFLAWRGTLLGAANSLITASPENIAKDKVEFFTMFSPGLYFIPGAISLILRVPLGIAMTVTVMLSMLACLVGWAMVVRTFAPRTSLALLVTVLIGSFRYSTSEFGIYHGGEILLQAATPWLILTAYRVPQMGALSAALLSAGAVFLAFLAKLTGIIVMAAALVVGALVWFAYGRRITRGMIGGAIGAQAALPILYITFFSRGWTAASGASWWSPPLFKSIAFASLVPWVAGISWSQAMKFILFPSSDFGYMPIIYQAIIVPPAILVISLILFSRPETATEKQFRLFSLWFYCVTTAVFILLFIHGAAIWLEERHYRSAGTLLFVCALMSAQAAGTPKWTRGLFLALCAVMALYGLASFSHRAWTTANGRSLDIASWTNQQMFDTAAIDFAKQAYAREGRDALFVLPEEQLAVTLPTDARILPINLNWVPVSLAARSRYSGRVPDHVFMLLPNTILDSGNGILDMGNARPLLATFTDYDPDRWGRKTFASMSVFFQ